MSVERIIMNSLKECQFGVCFTHTVEQILETIVERILMEDIDGGRFLEKVGVILHHYIEFNLAEALQNYGELRPKLTEFVASLGQNKENTAIRVRTWGKIVGILDMLAADGVRFLGIAASETGRIVRI
jgi:hypothetical protein